MEKLIKMDKVDLLASSDNTPKNMAAATVAEKYKTFFLINIAWPMMVEEMGYKYVGNFFFTPMGAARVPFRIWDSLPEGDKIKRPGLITEDNLDGQAFNKEFISGAKEFGYEFVMNQPSPIGNKDFSGHVLKLKAAKADALIFHGPPTDGIILLRQIREAGLKLKYIHGYKGFWPTEFLKAMGDTRRLHYSRRLLVGKLWRTGRQGTWSTLHRKIRQGFGKHRACITLRSRFWPRPSKKPVLINLKKSATPFSAAHSRTPSWATFNSTTTASPKPTVWPCNGGRASACRFFRP